MANDRAESISRLSSLIGKDDRNEVECGELLADNQLCSVLLPPGAGMVYASVEKNFAAGRSDLIVFAHEFDLDCERVKHAYIWELKAPQCYLFEWENRSRAKPTKHLFSAENQLSHYFNELRLNDAELKAFNVDRDNVHAGGILIGTAQRLIKPKTGQKAESLDSLRKKAFYARSHLFYRPAKIEVHNWSMIVRKLEMANRAHELVGEAPEGTRVSVVGKEQQIVSPTDKEGVDDQ